MSLITWLVSIGLMVQVGIFGWMLCRDYWFSQQVSRIAVILESLVIENTRVESVSVLPATKIDPVDPADNFCTAANVVLPSGSGMMFDPKSGFSEHPDKVRVRRTFSPPPPTVRIRESYLSESRPIGLTPDTPVQG